MTKWTLTTNPMARLFKRQLVVEISEVGISTNQNNELSCFKWEDLDSAPSLKTTISGGCLS